MCLLSSCLSHKTVYLKSYSAQNNRLKSVVTTGDYVLFAVSDTVLAMEGFPPYDFTIEQVRDAVINQTPVVVLYYNDELGNKKLLYDLQFHQDK